MEKVYHIKQVLNNSSILAEKDGQEMVVIGKGIGFSKKAGEELLLDDEQVRKFYADSFQADYFENPEILSQSSCIFNIIDETIALDKTNEELMQSLFNHLTAMLVRIQSGQEIVNPFEIETKILYSESYLMSQDIAEKVKDKMNVSLPSSEIAFLSLYLHCMMHDEDMLVTEHVNAIVYEVQKQLQEITTIPLRKETLSYARFIVHLKFFVYRILREEKIEESPLAQEIFKTYPEYIEFAEVITGVFEEQLQVDISESEKAYLILHLARLDILQNKQKDCECKR